MNYSSVDPRILRREPSREVHGYTSRESTQYLHQSKHGASGLVSPPCWPWLAATSGTDAIIDDLAGRKCGLSLNLHVRGTLGLVLLAKKKGMIPECRPVMEDLMRGGMYLSRRVLDEALKRVGE